MNQRSVLRVMLGLALAGPVGCGGGGSGTPATTPPGTGTTPGTGGTGGTSTTPPATTVAFTDDEKDSIASNLALMPDAPWTDQSNKYADVAAAATLGQKFYFETRYSANGQVACATCHNPAQGFQDGRGPGTSSGPDATKFTGRHAPTVINAAHGSGKASTGCWQFWDGRADSQWSQALGPPESGTEMGGTRTKIALLIWDNYKTEWEAVFGANGDKAWEMPLRDGAGVAIAPEIAKPGTAGDPGADAWTALSPEVQHAINYVYVRFGKAIAAYERKIVSRNSRFDSYLADFVAGKVDSSTFTDEEKLGLKVFAGKGKCISCHRGPNLSDWAFHNIGVPQTGEHVNTSDVGRQAGIETVTTGGFKVFNCASEWSDHPDKTQCAVATAKAKASDLGAFKTPGLREISKTGPYMHTGQLKTLEEVVDHYDQGGGAAGTYSGTLDRDVLKLELSKEEKAALVKFMKTLDGQALPAALMEAPKLPGT